MSGTPRLALPFLSPGQAQKEFFHNESLQTLDALVMGAVEEPPRPAPPSSPAVGTTYIVGSSPTAEWAGKAQSIAAFCEGGWRFITPTEGMQIYVKTVDTVAVFRTGAWEVGNLRCSRLINDGQQVVGARGAAIASPAGGSTIDAEARATIDLILGRLRTHGLIDA